MAVGDRAGASEGASALAGLVVVVEAAVGGSDATYRVTEENRDRLAAAGWTITGAQSLETMDR
jgi:hypothetical protein